MILKLIAKVFSFSGDLRFPNFSDVTAKLSKHGGWLSNECRVDVECITGGVGKMESGCGVGVEAQRGVSEGRMQSGCRENKGWVYLYCWMLEPIEYLLRVECWPGDLSVSK